MVNSQCTVHGHRHHQLVETAMKFEDSWWYHSKLLIVTAQTNVLYIKPNTLLLFFFLLLCAEFSFSFTAWKTLLKWLWMTIESIYYIYINEFPFQCAAYTLRWCYRHHSSGMQDTLHRQVINVGSRLLLSLMSSLPIQMSRNPDTQCLLIPIMTSSKILICIVLCVQLAQF